MMVSHSHDSLRLESLLQRRPDYGARLENLIVNNAVLTEGARYVIGSSAALAGAGFSLLSGTVVLVFGDEDSKWMAKCLLTSGISFTIIGLSAATYGTFKMGKGFVQVVRGMAQP